MDADLFARLFLAAGIAVLIGLPAIKLWRPSAKARVRMVERQLAAERQGRDS